MKHENWSCTKCKNKDYEIGEVRVAGSFWQKIFNVQRTKFSSITCKKCTFTEFFKSSSNSRLTDIFDLFTN